MKITKDQLIQLADAHINHYNNLINGYSRFVVNISECRKYQKLWESILGATFAEAKLEKNEISEIQEALYSGDYDYIVKYDNTKIEFPFNN